MGEELANGRFPRKLLIFVVPCLLSISLLLTIEIFIRLTQPHITHRDFYLGLFGEAPDATPSGNAPVFDGDAALFWILKPNLNDAIWDYTIFSTNADGLRHAGPIGAKPPGGLRLLFLGDSVTFGYRIPLVYPESPQNYDREDAPYPIQVEKRLRAANPGREIDAVNLAIPGYSTYQGLLLLRRFSARLEPDLVVICFGWNDVSMHVGADRDIMRQDWLDVALRSIASRSQALAHGSRWLGAKLHPPGVAAPMVARVSEQDYVDNILQSVALARLEKARVIVIGPVLRDATTDPGAAERMQHYRAALRGAMAGAHVPYLEIPELIETSSATNEALFGELIHPSSSGHALITARLLAFIARERLLAGVSIPASP